MAQIMAGDLRKGVTFLYENNIMTVVDFQHVKPGKGAAFVRTKMKNVVTGSVWLNSEYRAILTDDSGAETIDGIIEFDDAIDFPLHIPGDVAHDLLARTIVEGADGVSFSLSSGYNIVWITLDAGDLANIDEDGLTISISQPDLFL